MRCLTAKTRQRGLVRQGRNPKSRRDACAPSTSHRRDLVMRGAPASRLPFVPQGRKLTLAGLALAALLVAGCGAGPGEEPGERLIVLGIDGMDYELTRRFMDEGLMPNFSRLARQGSFQALGTSVPPLSPVAWSSFITGMDSGGHGVFDFFHRDPETMMPYLSISVAEPGKSVKLGGWQLPVGGGARPMRRGEPFWEVLEERGIPTHILRIPANFPPSGTASHELSGMGTPDLLGSPGTFSFYTSELFATDRKISGGKLYEAWPEEGVVRSELHGPRNPFRVEPEELTTELVVYLDSDQPRARIVVGDGDGEVTLEQGQWSDWVEVSFETIPTRTLTGICRFYLRQVRPEFELYVSPINLDPLASAQPISTPEGFAEELAAASGRFYTQGMPEDTKALTEGVLGPEEFLAQSRIAHRELVDQWEVVLERFQSGLLFYYFGNLDQTSHVMFRSIDPQHPAYDPEVDGPYAGVIPDLYRQADEIVGTTLEKLGDRPPRAGGTRLVVMSDHGFASFRRAFHLNTWLEKNGYLAMKGPHLENDPGFYANVDWTKTRAYGLGFAGLYINLQGRERDGIVAPGERQALMDEIAAGLLEVVDPETGGRVITKVYQREKHYQSRGALDIGPDIQVGYAETYRVSEESGLGGIPAELFKDNDDAWSGDHGMDPETVPGILLTDRPLQQPATSLKDLAASILAEFGIDGFPRRSDGS